MLNIIGRLMLLGLEVNVMWIAFAIYIAGCIADLINGRY